MLTEDNSTAQISYRFNCWKLLLKESANKFCFVDLLPSLSPCPMFETSEIKGRKNRFMVDFSLL